MADASTSSTADDRPTRTGRSRPAPTPRHTGVVTGRLTVSDDLPPELAKGLFAQPGSYDVVLRHSSEPGAIETDTVARARGASLKVLDVAEHDPTRLEGVPDSRAPTARARDRPWWVTARGSKARHCLSIKPGRARRAFD